LADSRDVPTRGISSRNVIWFASSPLKTESRDIDQHTTNVVAGQIVKIEAKLDVESFRKVPADSIGVNDIAEVEIETYSSIFSTPIRQTAGQEAS